MKYVNQRGSFDDMQLAQIVADFQTVYGGWKAEKTLLNQARFEQDVTRKKR